MAVTKWRSLDQRRILETALRFVDREGVEALCIRKLGTELRVEAMSLFSHVPNKSARLDGMVEVLLEELRIPAEDEGWEERIRGVFRRLAHEHPSSCPSS
jgi:AcrR family transcriptional regulator